MLQPLFTVSFMVNYMLDFAEDVCDEKIIIGSEPNNSSLIIKLLKNNSSKTIKSCKVEIESTNDHKIHINVKHMIDSYKAMDLKSQNTIKIGNSNENRVAIIQFDRLGDDINLVVTSYHGESTFSVI